MSHIVAYSELSILDLRDLEVAAESVGMEFVRDQQTYRWYGTYERDSPLPAGFSKHDLGKCDHAIRVPNNPHAYEIGVVLRRDGKPGWTLLADLYAGGLGLTDVTGPGLNRLKQAHAVQVVRRQLIQSGRRVTEQRLPNGNVVLQAVR